MRAQYPLGDRNASDKTDWMNLMKSATREIADLLLHCEETAVAPPYVCDDGATESVNINESPGPIVPVDSGGEDIFIVSDLHVASGRGADGRYDGCEKFYFDESFGRFLDHARRSCRSPNPILIINGDFIDFLRVTYVPGRPGRFGRWQRSLTQLKLSRRKNRISSLAPAEGEEFREEFVEWQRVLEKIGIDLSVDELVDSITDREELYGMKTSDCKSVLRLALVIKGHQELFEALAGWLGEGKRLIIVKGNHDLEWYWLAVRNYLRLDLAERLSKQRGGTTDEDVKKSLAEVLPRITFIDHAMLIDGDFYVEHGHPYDPLTRVIGKATVCEGRELNIPFGSFFNRYFIDFIELKYPNLDNIRPTQNILPLVLRHRFFTGLRMLYSHASVIAKTVPRRYVRYLFGQHIIWRVLLILLVVLVPPVLLVIHQIAGTERLLIKILEWALVIGGIYVAVQALAHFQLKEPESLDEFARLRFKENRAYRLISFGHTHNPDQFEERGRWFYNTGTWIPVIEISTAELREDRTFTYLQLTHNQAGMLQPTVLQRWDDDACRTEDMVLIKRAGF
jgi:UDP-2,3-diacylglucosamine pyrophosphatase LpxH